MSNSESILAERTQWIGGREVDSTGDEVMCIHDPADGSAFADVPVGHPKDAEGAVTAAAEAWNDWAELSPAKRGMQLRLAATKMDGISDRLADTLVHENGKTIGEARAEIGMCRPWMETYCELGLQLAGRSVQTAGDEILFQYCNPRGVSVCLNTWNAPVIAAIEMVVANLVVGNTVVLKTSERAPLATRMMFQECFDHLPAGVLNVVNGDGPNMGAPLVSHPGTSLVCFIGSVNVGRKIGEAAGGRICKAVLELGGKDAYIVDDTVDPVAAAEFIMPTCYALSGQICSSTERIYVMRNVYEPFVERLAALASDLKVGPGMDESSQMGPMIDETILANVERQVEEAVGAGATAVVGGKRLEREGYFYAPTVLTDVEDGMLLMHEETFGPVAPVRVIDSFEEGLKRTNDSGFGLCANVLTESAPRGIKAIHQLQAGVVRINAARGGILHCSQEPAKDSGIGMGHGMEFLHELTYRKSVRWQGSISS